MRRVVVTGLGAVTPLGLGARRTWKRLVAGESGLVDVATRAESKAQQAPWGGLTSTVAGIVPTGKAGRAEGKWDPSDWLAPSEQRRMSKFAQYAMAASEMALADASWKPTSSAELEATGVCLGSGIGNLDDLYTTSLAFEKDVSVDSWVELSEVVQMAKTTGRGTRKSPRCSSPGFSSTLPLAISP